MVAGVKKELGKGFARTNVGATPNTLTHAHTHRHTHTGTRTHARTHLTGLYTYTNLPGLYTHTNTHLTGLYTHTRALRVS